MSTAKQHCNNKLVKSSSIVSEIFLEYCSKTSIHGIGYLGAKDKSLPEKIWWVIVFLISIAACGYLITDTWLKWKENPVILSFSQKQTPIWKVPFPAVTICPLYKVNQTRFNYTRNYFERTTLSTEAEKVLWDISLICDLGMERTYVANNFTDENAISNIKDKSLNLKYMIKRIQWQNKKSELVELFFFTQLTCEGICYTFNSLNQNDIYTDQVKENVTYISDNNTYTTSWSIEDGYSDKNDNQNYPKRTSQDGSNSGLKIFLRSSDSERDFSCGEAISGYKVTLHNPAEAPRVNQKYFLVPLNKHVTVGVTPKVITSSKKLHKIQAKTRDCYLKNEKKLRFFQIYTKNNCKTECFANVTNSLCECVPFYMPRDDKTTICGLGRMACLAEVHEKIIQYEMMILNNKIEDNKECLTEEFQIFKNCDCMPGCASIDYTYDISEATHSWTKTLTVTEILNSKKETKKKFMHWLFGYKDNYHSIDELEQNYKTSKINIFFKESEFIALHRKELYGRTEFLANCGGLLGLFMGFSFLSLLEIIYYITIRLWIYLRKRNQPVIDVKFTE